MKPILLILITIILFSNCKKKADTLIVPAKKHPVQYDSITGIWALSNDSSKWCIVKNDGIVFFPSAIPRPLEGPDYSVNIQYSIDTTNSDTLILRTTTTYPTLKFYKEGSVRGLRQNTYIISKYEDITRLF